MDYQRLCDEELIDLIFEMEDRLGTDYVDEIKKRYGCVLPLLISVTENEENYQLQDREGWGIVHAVYLLGILADERATEALLTASELADKYDVDWIWDALPECYLRIGPTVIPALKERIERNKLGSRYSLSSEICGLWNIRSVHKDTRKDVEDFLLEVLKTADENYELRTNLIADFALIKRNDLRKLFEEYYERGEVDLDTLTREDLDDFYDHCDDSPGFRFDLEAFYSPDEIIKRQRQWDKEDNEERIGYIEEYILDNFNKIGRNEDCPCDSGKKFKKCHLEWAEEELAKERREEIIAEEEDRARQLISRERHYETLLRRFLARKGKSSLFNELKDKTIEVIKLPQSEYRSPETSSHLKPFISQVEFQDENDLEEFMANWTEYYNAIAEQYLGHPRNRRQLH